MPIPSDSDLKTDRRLYLYFGIAFLCSALATTALFFDHEFAYRWYIFTVWLVPQCALLAYLWYGRLLEGARLVPAWYWLLIIPLIAVRFCFLESAPFIAIHDEIRDGGLRALEIAQGVLRNIFATSWTQGLLYADLCSFFVDVFGNDVRVYRIVGAFVSAMELLILFLGLTRLKGPRVAMLATFVVGCLPIHNYFARTEPLVSFSSFFTTLILIALCDAVQGKDRDIKESGVRLGIIAGLALSFHASVRPIIFIAGLVMIVDWVRRLTRRETKWSVVVLAGLLYIAGTLAAFGPQLYWADLDYLVSGGRVTAFQQARTLAYYLNRYIESLSVYYNAPLQIMFQGQMLLTPLLLVAAILGFARFFQNRTLMAALCLIAVFAVPFTNSTITDNTNAAHRIFIAVVPLAILAADGVMLVIAAASRLPLASIATTFIVGSFLLLQSASAYDFFQYGVAEQIFEPRIGRPVNKALRFLVKRIQENPKAHGRLCIYAAPDSRTYITLLPPHINEFFKFFVPNVDFVPQASIEVEGEGVLYATFDCESLLEDQRWELIEPCKTERSVRCPVPLAPIKLYFAGGSF